MKLSSGRWILSIAFLLAALSLALSANAQVRIPDGAISRSDELAEVLREGAELERSRRWGEALNHYEEAVKAHPGQRDLAQRLDLARMHYDVGRRYKDGAFTASLRRTSEADAVEVYSEVLLKLQTNYVEEPNWQYLVDRGASQLGVALSEPDFIDAYFRGLTPQRIDAVRRELPQLLRRPAIRGRDDARRAVAAAARAVSARLGIPPQAIVMEYTCAATGGLDPFSSFLTAEQLGDVFSQIEGNFVGLGVELDVKMDPDALVVIRVIEGGPAGRSGLTAGDRIVKIDGVATADIDNDKAADMLRGPESSVVDLAVAAANGEVRGMRIRRERVEVPSVVDVKIIDRDEGIAYLRITSFQKNTTRDFDAALWKLHADGMRSLIVDVRGNPGGLLNSSVEIADKFVTSGNIVSTRGRSAREDFDYKAHDAGTWRVPLTVLIDGDSASASEIFAGAIRDHRRGTIVGVRSYGKGSVQGIFPLAHSKAGVRLTTAKFFSPNGHPISGRGVNPDVVVRVTAKPTGEPAADEDAILNAGLQIARQRLSRRSAQ